MAKKVKPNFLNSDAGLTAEIEVNRYRRGQFEATVAELEPRFPGLKAVLTHDPMEGKTKLDFVPDPPPATVTYIVSAPYPTYKVGPYTLRAVLSVDDSGKKGLWVVEEGAITREVVEEADFLRCDHCNTRRQRKSLFFFLKDGETTLTQVGTTCCKDFFGVDVEKELSKFWAELATGFADEEGWGYPQGRVNGLEAGYIVPVALVYVERFGYTSKTKAQEWDKPSTADDIQYVIDRPRPSDSQELKDLRHEVSEVVQGRKQELIDALNEYEEQARERLEKKWSEFLFNLCQNFEYTSLGFAAFIASDIIKQRAKMDERSKQVPSKCLDREITTKQDDLGTYTLTFQREEDGMYGTSYFHVAKAQDGTTVMFRRSTSALNVGDEFTLRGKVKKHLKDATVIGCPKPKVVKAVVEAK